MHAGSALGDLAVFVHNQSGDAEDLVLFGQGTLCIHIDLGDLQFGMVGGKLVNDGGELTAGTAPACEKVQQNGLIGMEHFLLEVGFMNMQYRHFLSSCRLCF